jgi:hypothetical protein
VSTEIYTRADGTPFAKPDRADYETALEYFRAMWAYRDAIADYANKEFDAAFRKALKGGAGRPFTKT